MCFKQKESTQESIIEKLIKLANIEDIPPFGKFNIVASGFTLIVIISVNTPEIADTVKDFGIFLRGFFSGISLQELIELTTTDNKVQSFSNVFSLVSFFVEIMACMIFTFFADRTNKK